jgi:UDP-N-acetylmuramate--alanine ligase
VPRFGANYRLGKSQYFVNEADEFNNNFWHYHPRLAVITSIEFEHPEFFANYEEYLASFEHFVRGMDMQGDWPFPPTLIVNSDSPGCLELIERLADWQGRIITYAIDGQADVVAYDLKLAGETSFRVRTSDGAFDEKHVIHLQLPGAHNVQNALAALTAARAIDLDKNVIVRTLEDFGGIRRRFEIRHQGPLSLNAELPDVVVVDDYAHHPTAIATTLAAARRRFPTRRLVAVYQPHMYSRTRTFFGQFLTAFNDADIVVLADIYPGREHDTGLIHTRALAEAMARQPEYARGEKSVIYAGSVQETADKLRQILRGGDLVIIMGAGDIYRATEMLLQDTLSREKEEL